MAIEESDIIETPENIDLQRHLAGIGSRFWAGLLDVLLIGVMVPVPVILFLMFDLHQLLFGDRAAAAAGKQPLRPTLERMGMLPRTTRWPDLRSARRS